MFQVGCGDIHDNAFLGSQRFLFSKCRIVSNHLFHSGISQKNKLEITNRFEKIHIYGRNKCFKSKEDIKVV